MKHLTHVRKHVRSVELPVSHVKKDLKAFRRIESDVQELIADDEAALARTIPIHKDRLRPVFWVRMSPGPGKKIRNNRITMTDVMRYEAGNSYLTDGMPRLGPIRATRTTLDPLVRRIKQEAGI